MEPAAATAVPAVFRLPLEEPPDVLSADGVRAAAEGLLLRENAHWFCRLRWLVTALLAASGMAALVPALPAAVGLNLSPGWPLELAAVLAALNAAYLATMPWIGRNEAAGPVRLHLWTQILADLVILTAVVHFLGSVETAAPLMYLFHVILACIFLPPLQSLGVLTLAAALYIGCLALEGWHILAPTTAVAGFAVVPRAIAVPGFWLLRVLPVLAVWVVIWHLTSRLAGALREREERLAVAHARLKASVEERAAHMLQTTHQLKSPFAAIHANTQLLLGEYCGVLPERARTVIEKIAVRCAALSQMLLDMLQLANLRSEGQAAAVPTELDLADILRAAIARVEPPAALRGITIQAQLAAVKVHAAEDHLKMLFDNLLTNAVNYSFDGGVVAVSCRRGDRLQVLAVVRDHGIGIPADQLPRVFEDYYRTREAVRHNKTSTGLGLAIVRHVARQLAIEVQVESSPGWGTQFTLAIPCRE